MTAETDLPEGPPIITEAMFERWTRYPDPISVKVQHSGLRHTKDAVVSRQIERLEKAATVQEFLAEYINAHKKWDGMHIFKSINYNLEPDTSSKKGFKAIVQFQELEEKSVGISIQREQSSTTPEVRFSDNNLFGRAWEATLSAQGPHEAHRQINLSLKQKNPAFGLWNQWTLFNRARILEGHSLKRQQIRGLSFGCQMGPSQFGQHYFETGLEIRDMQPHKDEGVSEALYQDQGESEKTYIRHDCTLSQLTQEPGDVFPKGLHLWTSNEVAGSTNTVRHDVKAECYVPLLERGLATLSLHAKLGFIWAFSGVSRIRVQDRYSLDSAYVRGYRGLGPGAPEVQNPPPVFEPPEEQPGGNVLGAASASLNFILPGIMGPVTGHVFANAGNMEYNENRQEVLTKEYAQKFIAGAKASVGCGLVIHVVPLWYGRMEFNLAFPLDRTGQPIQYPASHVFDKFKLSLNWSNS
uniref:Bacterial surface antigen (D15) domain-containing protein n=1 Tax=Eutreptiella gymnastica TaxID=73025 RepID=A0A7S1ITD8_9EUGL